MHDPFLKSVLADRRMIEILIRDHVPEWADAIDFSTLRQEPTALVSKKTLQRRHPDMIWSAETTDAFMAERMELPGTDDIDRVIDALCECGTGEEFIERVRTA